jgi:hypothetical protein
MHFIMKVLIVKYSFYDKITMLKKLVPPRRLERPTPGLGRRMIVKMKVIDVAVITITRFICQRFIPSRLFPSVSSKPIRPDQ